MPVRVSVHRTRCLTDWVCHCTQSVAGLCAAGVMLRCVMFARCLLVSEMYCCVPHFALQLTTSPLLHQHSATPGRFRQQPWRHQLVRRPGGAQTPVAQIPSVRHSQLIMHQTNPRHPTHVPRSSVRSPCITNPEHTGPEHRPGLIQH